jgi:uncharacterized membrane protein
MSVYGFQYSIPDKGDKTIMKHCANCGQEMADEMKFCPYCGTAAVAAAASEAAASVEQAETDGILNAQETVEAGGETVESQAGDAQGSAGTQESAGAQYSNAQNNAQGNPYAQYTRKTNTNEIPENNRTASILCYWLSFLGWFIAFMIADRKDPYVMKHLNQGLVINLFSMLWVIPVIGWIWEVFIIVCRIIGTVNAAEGKNGEVPLIGSIHMLDEGMQ